MTSFLHLCTQDGGGAGLAAVRLHQAMLSEGRDSRLVVRFRSGTAPNVQSTGESGLRFRFSRLGPGVIQRLNSDSRYCVYSALSGSRRSIVDAVCALARDVDVVVLHWIAYFLDANDVRRIARSTSARVVWYALDMAPMTGGCHYSWGCEQYVDGCEQCPATRSTWLRGRIRTAWKARRSLFSDQGVRVIAPNRWVGRQVQAAIGLAAPLSYIPVPSTRFRPLATEAEPNHSHTVFFGHANMAAERKGGDYFVRAMQILHRRLGGAEAPDGKEVVVQLPGDGSDTSISSEIPFRTDWVARATDDESLNRLYARADCFVNTSVEDSGPMMLSEALMTGTPIVSFRMGAAEELVGETGCGFIAELGDAEGIADAIYQFVSKSAEDRRAMSVRARDQALSMFDVPVSVKTFETAVNSL